MKTLEFYIKAFRNLKRAHNLGGAPHKPIMLLALIKAFEHGVYNSNKIRITPELISFFKSYWTSLVTTGHKESFVLPFYHMKGEKSKFWKLIAIPGYQFAITSSNSIKSFKALTEALDYVEIDIELANILLDKTNRNVLSEVLLSEYFNDNAISRVEQSKGDYFKEVQTRLFNEPHDEYIERVKNLYGDPKSATEETEIETFTRGEIFKREIPKIYNYSCAITSMRIDGVTDISMVDACHIVPFHKSFDDTLTNGIALCPNMHRALDRGLIAIDDDYRLVVANIFMEQFSHYSIKQYDRKEILLPDDQTLWPSLEKLRNHRESYDWFNRK